MAQKRENESIKSRKEPKIEEFCAEIEKTLLKNFADSKIIHTFALVKTNGKTMPKAFGEMAEWSIAAVLKTVEGHTSGGSNPSLSAINIENQ